MRPNARDEEGDPGSPRESPRLRMIVAVAIALLIVLVMFALPRTARASTGALAPPHSDAGLDTDTPPNGLFDYLVITIHVNVTVAGGFIFIVVLRDGSGATTITQGMKVVDLPAGPSGVDVRLSGAAIRTSGFDGPYNAQIMMLNDTMSFMGVNIYTTTGTYTATSFDPVPATLAPPHADSGVDTNADGKFDHLAVDVFLNVTEPGPYTVSGTLRDSPPTTTISSASNTTYLAAGIRVAVRLRFSGTDIRAAGMNGPFQVDLTLSSPTSARLGTDVYNTTATYFLSDFVAPGAALAPPHEALAVDLDGDGFYDFLVVNAVVSVTDPGFYRVGADIGAIPLHSEIRVYLPAGTQVVQTDFIGHDLFTAGVNGPYNIDLTLSDDNSRVLDRDLLITTQYFAIDFEPSPLARWVPPTTDSGLDNDANGLWDALVVNATVDATRHGSYRWTLEVWDAAYTTSIASASGTLDLVTGTNPVQMRVPGLSIWQGGIDGPYGLDLYLYDANGRQVDRMRYTTATAYRAIDFETLPARLTPPYVDLGLDRTGDGILDVIAVDVPVTVTHAGAFILTGGLLDSTFSVAAYDQTFADLSPGLTTVRLYFSGTDLFRSGQNGAFFAFLSLGAFVDGVSIPLGTDTFVTHDYTSGPFDHGPDIRLSGVVRASESGTPLDGQDIIVWSPATRLQRQMNTDPTGYYETWLPRGTYIVVADSGSRNAAGSNVSVASNTTLNFSLDLPPPETVTGNIAFSGWNDAAVQADFIMGPDAVLTRLQVDAVFGNGDGFVSQSELDRILLMGQTPELPVSTQDMFTVDGSPYARVNGTSSLSIAGAGPVTSTAPITGTLRGSFTAPTPVATTPLHRARFLATYDTFSHTETFSLGWPATYGMKSFDPVPAVSVGGTVSQTTVDPAADPNPRDFAPDVWVNLTVGTTDASPPLVTGAALDGRATLRTKVGPDVTVTATASDAGRGDWAIAAANFTVGAHAWATSTPMAAQDGAFDSPTEAVTGTLVTVGLADGTHSVCVYAKDVVPNADTTGSCATLVIDDFPPVASNVLIDGAATKTVVVGTDVVLTARVSDASTGGSAITGANFTRGAAAWPGTPMNASDGTFNGSVEDVTARVATTGLSPGTYDLCVYGTDEVGNGATTQACAQLVVLDQDLTPPDILGVRALPNPANTTVAVNLSAVVTDNVGVETVFIQVFDAAGTSVANLTASFDPATGRYYVNRTFAAAGAYTFRVSARDTSGNWQTATGSFTITAPPSEGPALADLWWLFVIVAAVTIAAVAVGLWARRRRSKPESDDTEAAPEAARPLRETPVAPPPPTEPEAPEAPPPPPPPPP